MLPDMFTMPPAADDRSLPPQRFVAPRCSVRTIICVFLNLVAFAFLLPGLQLPLMTVSVFVGEIELFHQTRSIIGTVRFLHQQKAHTASLCILTFSVLIPFVKFVALLSICFSSSSAWRRRLFVLIRDGSKWSMADVFVTAVFVAFLSAHTAANTMDAKVENGFYFFLAYCLLSLAAMQVMPVPTLKEVTFDERTLVPDTADDFDRAPSVRLPEMSARSVDLRGVDQAVRGNGRESFEWISSASSRPTSVSSTSFVIDDQHDFDTTPDVEPEREEMETIASPTATHARASTPTTESRSAPDYSMLKV